MALSENIRQKRKASGLSQEQLAEQMGVSRQAVTKWESGQSAPSTENLIRLSKLLNTTVEQLTDVQPKPQESASPIQSDDIAAQMLDLMEKHLLRKKALKLDLLFSVWICLLFILIYIIDRCIHIDLSQTTVIGFLFDDSPGNNCYLIGWLHHNRLYWICPAVSVIFLLFDRRYFALTSSAGFLIGLFCGIAFGYYPADVPYGQSRLDWAICGCIYIAFLLIGIILQTLVSKGKLKKRKETTNEPQD